MESKAENLLKLRHTLFIAVAISLLTIIQHYVEHALNGYDFQFSWFSVSAKVLLSNILWAFVTPFLFKKILTQLTLKNLSVVAITQALISLPIALVHRVFVIRLYDVFYYFKTGFFRDFLVPGNQVELGAGFFTSLIQYWVIVGLLVAIAYYARFIGQKRELSSAKLNALKTQLQPHFLFNTLNSISALIEP